MLKKLHLLSKSVLYRSFPNESQILRFKRAWKFIKIIYFNVYFIWLCAQEDSSRHVPPVTNLQEVCDGTALAALISFYCPEALHRDEVRLSRAASLHDCLHNLRLLHQFCRTSLPHHVFHMMPEDVAYMRGYIYI